MRAWAGAVKVAPGFVARCFVAAVVTAAGCDRANSSATINPTESELTIGFGLSSGESGESGIRERVTSLALEGLVTFSPDARAVPRLAEKWSVSPDGLVWRLDLRPNVMFHDGEPLTARLVRDILIRSLPSYMGPAFDDIRTITATSALELEFVLKRRSRFVLESLDVLIQRSADPPVGTGPFYVPRNSSNSDEFEMLANGDYYAGKPLLDRVIFRPYQSIRSAWADMLRGEVDMLYEVGIDALDLVQPSSQVQVFAFERPYAYMLVLNTRRQHFRREATRRALNEAIDRNALVAEALFGYGEPADGPVWPRHWAYDQGLPSFHYRPAAFEAGLKFTCFFADASLERLALVVQRQLREVGVEVDLQFLPVDQALARLEAGNFDAFLTDIGSAPTMVRSFVFWYSGSAYNWGGFESDHVNAALDAVRYATSDEAYATAVGSFQRAIIEDPPAIFLAWSRRARAVSTRFEVPAEPGRDILSTLRLWRPVADKQTN
jgi:peptide/nickel transport system substrate-binding protein